MNARKPVLFLGGSSDIALAVARNYAAAGFPVLLTARDPQVLETTCQDFNLRYGVQAQVLQLDIDCEDSRGAFLEEISPEGGLEGIVCSIGVMVDQQTAQERLELVREMFDVNFSQTCLMIEELLTRLVRGSFVIGISSVAGDRGRKKNYFYGAAKAGFNAYLSGLRNRLDSEGVQVLTVKPGFVRTKMTVGMNLPPALVVSPKTVARDIFKAQRNGKNQIYTPWFWYWIMLVIRIIPERIFKRLSI